MGERDTSSLRILVADDNRDAADTLRLALEINDYSVAVAYDGAEALRTAERFEPQVALLDIGMPGMNGFDLASALRQRFGRQILLVAVTGWSQANDIARGVEAGFDRHFAKPVDLRSILQVVAEAAAAEGRGT